MITKKIFRPAKCAPLFLSIGVLILATSFPSRAVAQVRELKAEKAQKPSLLLVASPELKDPFFRRSVVMMLPPGRLPLIVGVIVNKPMGVTLGKLFPNSRLSDKRRQHHVYFGGPVEAKTPLILFRAGKGRERAVHVLDDIFFSPDPELIADVLNHPRSVRDFRVYMGRAQWAPRQLRGEMASGAWYALKGDPAAIFTTRPEKLWEKLIATVGLHNVTARSNYATGASARLEPLINYSPDPPCPYCAVRTETPRADPMAAPRVQGN